MIHLCYLALVRGIGEPPINGLRAIMGIDEPAVKLYMARFLPGSSVIKVKGSVIKSNKCLCNVH